MSIDIEATKTNERFIQAELYCKLKEDIRNAKLITKGKVGGRRDVLVEASIKQNKGTKPKARKRTDLVLIWKESGNVIPLLVIELKKRRLGSPTHGSKGALKQAYSYARQVGSNLYATYNGDTFVLMQMGYPFLIGLKRIDIFGGEFRDIGREVWEIALDHSKGTETGPLPPFDDYSVYPYWKTTMKAILGDAHRRSMVESGTSVKKEQTDEVVEEIMSIWQKHFSS